MKKNKAAFFDVDGTLLKCSTWKEMTKFLMSQNHLSISRLSWRMLQFFFSNLHRLGFYMFKYNQMHLRGFKESFIRTKSQELFEKKLKNDFNKDVLGRLKDLQSKGYIIVLLTGTHQFFAEILKKHLGADYAFSSYLEVKNGVLSGKSIGIYPFAKDKAKIVKTFAKKNSIDLKSSWAFGDHYTDKYVLELVGHPVVVNPGRKLLGLAKKKGWKILNNLNNR